MEFNTYELGTETGNDDCLPSKGIMIANMAQHLYNGLKLGKDEVESISIWTNEDGWDRALTQAKPWLLY